MTMKPLRFEWQLSSPLAGMALPLHLDALVAYAVTESSLQSGKASGSIRSLADKLPLEKAENEGLWCWKASALRPSEEVGQGIISHETRLWTRRTNEMDYATKVVARELEGNVVRVDKQGNLLPMKPYAGVIDTQRGLLKNQFQFIPVKRVLKVVAYCIGNEDHLLELLHPDSGLVRHLGARGRSGFGNIIGFNYAEDADALDRWQERIMPWPVPAYVPIQAAHQPPYWAAEQRAPSYIHASLLS